MNRELNISIPSSNLTRPMAGRDHVQGPTDAPLTLLEYGDYECPYCGDAHSIVKAVQKRLGRRLCFAFRNFPLVDSHPHAEHAAEAAEAAGAQGKFWQMYDVLYENQEALEDEDLANYGSTLGLDAERLVREVRARAHLDRIREDVRSGTQCEVNGTPTFFINGVLYDGDPGVDRLLEALTEREGK